MAMGMVTPSGPRAGAGPPQRVIAIDGDGSLLLNLGALTTVANAAPPNLIVLVFDNELLRLDRRAAHRHGGGDRPGGAWPGRGRPRLRTVNGRDFRSVGERRWPAAGPG